MTTKQKFKAGQTVYSIHGEAASYIARTQSGHAVEPMYEYEEGEPYFGPVASWPEVFCFPPVAKLNDKVKELEERIEQKRQELKEIDGEKSAIEAEMATLQARYKKNDQLKNLDLWISGAVTHLVKVDHYSGFTIGTVEQILGYDNDREMRLLSIYGGTKNHYRWKMASYSDGSGSSTEVLLATSEEEAKQVATAWYSKEIISRGRNNQDHVVLSLAKSAMKYGLPVTDELRQKVAESEALGRQRMIESAQKDLDRAKANLESLQAEAQP